MPDIENEEEKLVEISVTYKLERIGELSYIKEIEDVTPKAYYSYLKGREECLKNSISKLESG